MAGGIGAIVAYLGANSRSIGTIIPDVVIEEAHRDSLVITQHPVEKGAAITDHAFAVPSTVVIRAGFSNSSAGYEGYARQVYQAFLAWRKSRDPRDVSTGKRRYRTCSGRHLGHHGRAHREHSRHHRRLPRGHQSPRRRPPVQAPIRRRPGTAQLLRPIQPPPAQPSTTGRSKASAPAGSRSQAPSCPAPAMPPDLQLTHTGPAPGLPRRPSQPRSAR